MEEVAAGRKAMKKETLPCQFSRVIVNAGRSCLGLKEKFLGLNQYPLPCESKTCSFHTVSFRRPLWLFVANYIPGKKIHQANRILLLRYAAVRSSLEQLSISESISEFCPAIVRKVFSKISRVERPRQIRSSCPRDSKCLWLRKT